MSRLVKSFLLGTALLFASVPAFAGPIAYPNSANINTPQDAANYVIQQLNNGGGPGISYLVTGTTASNALTLNGTKAIITTETSTAAHGTVYSFTWTDSAITAVSIIQCSASTATSTDSVLLANVVPAAGSAVLKVQNNNLSAALNGAITLYCTVFN